MIIAVDGPSGSGKSTISKIVANNLKINYLDTGAMYRAVTLYALENKLNLDDENIINAHIENINITYKENILSLNGYELKDEIRQPLISQNVSKIASYKCVREFLVSQQQIIGQQNDCILDGRDIASVVFPNADYKFYLNASAEMRAHRRYLENKDKEFAQTESQILEEIKRRDILDSTREESPLIKVSEAIEIDTSNIGIDEVVAEILKNIK
jgi:cytidylate kinase